MKRVKFATSACEGLEEAMLQFCSNGSSDSCTLYEELY